LLLPIWVISEIEPVQMARRLPRLGTIKIIDIFHAHSRIPFNMNAMIVCVTAEVKAKRQPTSETFDFGFVGATRLSRS